VTPDAEKEKEVAAVVDELGVEAFSFTGPFGQVGDQQRVVEQAWALADVEQRYVSFLSAASSLSPDTPPRRSARRSSSCRSGDASRSSTRPCRPSCSRRPGPAPPPPSSSTGSTRVAPAGAGALGDAVHISVHPDLTHRSAAHGLQKRT
jgi:hypothetical protein